MIATSVRSAEYLKSFKHFQKKRLGEFCNVVAGVEKRAKLEGFEIALSEIGQEQLQVSEIAICLLSACLKSRKFT
jgi:hypothetical protein